jgi:hypothetical protein
VEVDEETEEFVRVVVDIPDPDMGVSGERLWAVPITDDVYEIRSSPWHARNINWGDWVRAVSPSADQWPRFVSIVKRSGHRTIRIYFFKEFQERREEILKEINSMGAFYEGADDHLYAVDCAPEVTFGPIVKYLTRIKNSGVLDFTVSEY